MVWEITWNQCASGLQGLALELCRSMLPCGSLQPADSLTCGPCGLADEGQRLSSQLY